MNRRELLQSIAVNSGVAAAFRAQTPPRTGNRPNILFLMTDEHRADCVGYTNPALRTPHLDQLAAGSVVFTRAYSTSPSCVPARAAIYTGRYPSQCGAPTYITYLPSHETTFMARIRNAGYHTAVIGKQHFGATNIDRGYDYEDIIDSSGASGTSYARFLESAGLHPRRMRSPAGRFAFRWEAEQRFHVDDYIGEQARLWMKQKRPAGKPWFLAVSFIGPHQPFDGLGLDFAKQYSLNAIPMPETSGVDLNGKPPHFRRIEQTSGNLTEQEIRQTRLSYFAKISLIDSKIGAIIEELKATGEYDNTLIVFTADHGDYMGDFGLVYKAQYLSEVLMRVPLLAKPPLPGFRGRREQAFVSNFDIAPTCLSLAGVDLPPDMAARDLSPFWRSPENAARRAHCFMDGQGLQGIRDERWKLVHYRERPYGELYDLQADPWEKRNLWDDPSAAAVKASLQHLLLDHMIGIAPRSHVEWNRGAPKI